MLMTVDADCHAPVEPALAPWPDRGTARELSMPETMLATPFGRITVAPDKLVDIPGGLLGFPGQRKFALAPIPDERLARFMLLQSVEEPTLSFIVVPLAPESGLVDAEDISEICTSSGTEVDDALIFLIVTVRKGADGVTMTVNLRAPVVVDSRRMSGRQCVFSNNRYSIRHAL